MIAKPNRDAKTNPQGDKSCWCNGCDRNLVQDGHRCEVCGWKNRTKRRKVSKRNVVSTFMYEDGEERE